MLARAGSVIPLLACETDTLSEYGPGTPTVVRASDRDAERTLLAWPLGPSRFAVAEDQTCSCELTDAGWRLVLGDGPRRGYTLWADLRAPCPECRAFDRHGRRSKDRAIPMELRRKNPGAGGGFRMLRRNTGDRDERGEPMEDLHIVRHGGNGWSRRLGARASWRGQVRVLRGPAHERDQRRHRGSDGGRRR